MILLSRKKLVHSGFELKELSEFSIPDIINFKERLFGLESSSHFDDYIIVNTIAALNAKDMLDNLTRNFEFNTKDG